MDSVLTVLLKVKARMTDVRFFSDGVSAQDQHANNKRTAIYDSLLILSTMLLAKARSYELQTPTEVVPDPDIMSMAKDKQIRRKCFYCDSRTDWFCFWCRRWLCNSRPNKMGRKAPK